jgi:hypothetical protein
VFKRDIRCRYSFGVFKRDIRCRYSFGVFKRGFYLSFLISSPFPLARGRGDKGG